MFTGSCTGTLLKYDVKTEILDVKDKKKKIKYKCMAKKKKKKK